MIASLLCDERGRLRRANRAEREPSLIGDSCRLSRLDSSPHDGVTMADNSMTGTFQIPKDLLLEAKRAAKPKSEGLHVEGWRNSWLSRIAEMLVGKD